MGKKAKLLIIFSGLTATILAVFLYGSVLWLGNSKSILGEKILRPAAKLEVDFLDVGQGDAELIKTPGGQNILIDGGPNARVVERLSEVMAPWDKQIDLMILTHPHDDHVTGLKNVLDRYEVKRILYTGVNHTSPNYLAWLEEVNDKKIPLVIVDHPQVIKLGNGCDLEILYPLKSYLNQKVENLNNTSIVARLVFGKLDVLYTGDAEEPEEKELLKAGSRLEAQILKVGHHGSDTATSEKFLKAVNPRMAVIEVGKDNSFNHPSRRTLKKLERGRVEILRTDERGTIKIVSDGQSYEVE